jgi:hypothetical protein
MLDSDLVITTCECKFRLGIQKHHIEEVASGVWGSINCINCGAYLNEKIKKNYEQYQNLIYGLPTHPKPL